MGITRSIARLGVVLPIYQKTDNLIYMPLIGMLDINNANELNIGIGYRQIINQNYILGGYGFFDYRKSQFDNFFKQVTLGLELFFDTVEFRANVYLPEQKSKLSFSEKNKNISVQYDGTNTQYMFSSSRTRYQENPNYGGDVEAGFSFGRSNIYLAYYYFSNKFSNKSINGVRVRSTHKYTDLVSYNLELSYDKKRKLNAFVGFSISFTSQNYISILRNKMTSLPIRDVDIIVDIDESTVVDDVSTDTYSGFVPLVDLEMFTENSLGGTEAQDNIFIDTSRMVGLRNVDDILIHVGNSFKLLSELEGEVLEQDSSLVEQYNRVFTPILNKNSSLYKAYQSGFWSSAEYKKKMQDQFDKFRSKYQNLNVDQALFNQIMSQGISRQLTYNTLEFLFRDVSNVKVILYASDTDTNNIPVAQNVAEINTELNRNKLNTVTNNQRFIVGSFSMERHATALIVDRQKRVFYYMDSNIRKLSSRQIKILEQAFGTGYSYQYPTIPRQRESWSCAQHTVQNIQDFFDGCIQRGIVGTNRDMSFILEKNLYLYAAYKNSGTVSPVTLAAVHNSIECQGNSNCSFRIK
ncbi:MAG: hypothetical protein HRT87_04675 [Legionellales bacterium]|nr:hypothetical protein [Legionellales bacterium]